MSGDVQTRKRKEKKRKKDESNDESQHLQKLPAKIPPVPTDVSINTNIHKEGGGGFCAKIVFFILLTALAVLIGLIITEHRGLTDVDSIKSDSKFSRIFDNWIEKSPSEEHDDDLEDKSEEQLYSHEDNTSEENEASQEDELDSNEENTEEDEEDIEKTEEDEYEEIDEKSDEDEEEEEEEEEIDEKPDEDEEEEDDDQERTEENEEESDEVENEKIIDENEDDNNEDTKDKDISDENKSKDDEGDDSDEEDGDDEIVKRDTNDKVSSSEKRKIASKEEDSLEGENEDTENVSKEINGEDSESPQAEKKSLKDIISTLPVGTTYVIIKFGVGAGIVVVAYVVLVKKWKNAEKEDVLDEEIPVEKTQIKNRRNTIVSPPKLEDIEPDIQPGEDNELTQEDIMQSESSATPKEFNQNEEKRQKSESDKVIDIFQNEIGEEQKPETGTKDEYSAQDASKTLDEAIHQISDDPAYALHLFAKLLEKNPSSLKALYGKAEALNSLAAKKKSNTLLEEAINTYLLVLQSEKISNEMYKEVAERCIERMRFRGYFGKAISVHKSLIDKFPDSLEYKYQLVITYLTINRIKEARQLLQKILATYPDNGFALVHYGFILKTIDNDLNKSVEYLRKGISTKAEGVIDGRFYFHLGDALTKLGKIDEAQQVYVEGVENKLFLSKYQRSLYNVNRLKAKPFWNKKETPYVDFFNMLEKNWQNIRDEGMALLNNAGYFEDESENLRDIGEWKQLELFARGIKKKKNCQSCPFTCSMIERLHDARYCRRGQVKFSVMHPGTHVWPHCGPTNCRLRAHLGLKVPDNTFIRVGDKIRSWNEGKILIFDDSFEHEVWHNGTEIRLVLIIDIWHPELSEQEKRSLPAI